MLCRLISGKNSPVWINCRGEVINDNEGKLHYIIGCMNETGTRQRADNISGLLGEKEMASYLYSQPKEKLSGYFIQIGINDFGIINNVHGQIYGNYILKRVAECIAECLSSGQKIYHLVTDKYMLVDMLSKSHDEVVQLFKRIGEKIDEFIVDENYKSIFSVSAGVTDISTLAEGAIECRKKSDFSLKCAKKRGGGSLYFFEEEDYKASLRKNTILSALRSATVNEAALHAVRSGRTVVNESDIEESIEVVIAGYQKKNAVLSDQEKKVATFTGGRAAEEIVFGEITTGASNDIEQATKIARAMITRYGMTDEFDMVAMETVTNQYLGGDTSLSCSADTQKEIDEKVVQLVKAEHEKARKILAENREKLDELAMYLYEKETENLYHVCRAFYLICFSFSCFHNSKFRIILFRTTLAIWIIFFDLPIFAVGIMPDIFSDFIESCHSPLDYVKGINTMGAVRSVFIYTLCDPFGTITCNNLDAG